MNATDIRTYKYEHLFHSVADVFDADVPLICAPLINLQSWCNICFHSFQDFKGRSFSVDDIRTFLWIRIQGRKKILNY